ncbi:MAG TPA: universal stress protein [Puia sp.]|nr:universal stress protein [Puia sp.]
MAPNPATFASFNLTIFEKGKLLRAIWAIFKIAKKGFVMSYQKILIAVDGSAGALAAARAGFELAQNLHAAIGLVFVVDRTKEVINADIGITPEESQTVLLKQAQETLTQLVQMHASSQNIFRFTPEGFPKKEILQTAKEWDADLIIIGARCQTPLGRILNGDLVRYVIKHSVKPVMVVN